MNDIALIDRARRALAEAKTVEDALEVRHQADAVARYMSRRDGAEEAARHATEIRLRAERRIGQMLAASGERRGGVGGGASKLPQGISPKNSHKWKRVADLPEPDFEEVLAQPEPTTAALLKRHRVLSAPQSEPVARNGCCTVRDLDRLAELGRRFGCIYADPPWSYGNQATRASTDNHYGTMSVEDISALPVADLAADDAHLHLWTTNGFLREAFDVMEAWGFEYRSCFVWVKPQLGIGNYWRVSHEFMLFGRRGNAPFLARDLSSWLEADRTKHSKKPEKVRGFIERASPGPFLELFGRGVADGWTVWGNEIQRDLLVSKVEEL